jgi:hypothetical protein
MPEIQSNDRSTRLVHERDGIIAEARNQIEMARPGYDWHKELLRPRVPSKDQMRACLSHTLTISVEYVEWCEVIDAERN